MGLISNLPNKPLCTTSLSNPHILTQNLSTSTSLASETNEWHFPDMWHVCKFPMLSEKHHFGRTTTHKLPLTVDNFNTIFAALGTNPTCDDGGATVLMEVGVALVLIQVTGKWSLDTFNCYIWKNIFLFLALLIGQPSLIQTNSFHPQCSLELTWNTYIPSTLSFLIHYKTRIQILPSSLIPLLMDL